MPTAADCRARAEEAERLARLVSYERDRTRLLHQAQEWRDKAAALEAQVASAGSDELEPPAGQAASRFRRWLGLR